MQTLLILAAGLAFAGDVPGDVAGDGDILLAQVDAAQASAADGHVVMDVQVVDRRGNTAERTLEIWQKGGDKRLVRYTAPARLAGTGLLVPDGETVYLYMPAYGRARRVVGERRNDAFLGTDFSVEDLARLTWCDDFTATVTGRQDGLVALHLTPRDPSDEDPVNLWVRSEDHLATRIEVLDSAGVVIRRLDMSDFRSVGARQLAHRFEVHDLVDGGHTTATVTLAETNMGLDDELFTITNLSR
jgi:outer membrane lipoprotein-sorting protein